MEAYDDQAAVDAAFADLAHLLDVPEQRRVGTCVSCGSADLERTANLGQCVAFCSVCRSCGVVQPSGFGQDDTDFYRGRSTVSNYKRIHHWHERISQFLLQESSIPDGDMLRIAERICDGSYTVINKDVIRQVLRSLNMQMYIEKWLQIIQRITGVEPPKPGGALLRALDDLFLELQVPFRNFKWKGRKNFLNYNYVFCRLWQKVECEQFCMFFPLIKSRLKLKALDDTWHTMTQNLGWEVTPLQLVPPFAVKLERPELLLQRLQQRASSAAPAETRTELARTGFRKSDQHLLRELDRQRERERRRSTPLAPAPRRSASKKRPLPWAAARELQPLRRSLPQRQLG